MHATPDIDPLGLYASGIDTSDYVARVAPLVRAAVPATGDLLDLGAGGGQLGCALREAGHLWTAVEPAASMRARLARLQPAPRIIASGWDEAEVTSHDTVLAANMPAPLTDAARFLERCRAWARRAIAWVVPAQHGPRGLCLAGCLPKEWHGEDETPGVDIVLGGLAPQQHPRSIARVDWTFALEAADLERLAAYLSDRLGWAPQDTRRSELHRHLSRQAKPAARGVRLEVPRASAILTWT